MTLKSRLLTTIFFVLTLTAAAPFASAREVCGDQIAPQDQAGCDFLQRAGLAPHDPAFESPQSQQFLSPLLAVADALAPASGLDPAAAEQVLPAILEKMRLQDTRGQLFALEGLFHMYSTIKNPEIPKYLMVQGRSITKGFEDRLGDYVDGQLYLQRARTIQALEQTTLLHDALNPFFVRFPDSIIDGLKIERQERTRELIHYLVAGADGSWISLNNNDQNGASPIAAGFKIESPYRVILKAAAVAGRLDPASDRLLLLKAVRKQLKSFMARFSKAPENTKKFDFSQLQGETGVHELRRQLRWFAIDARATHGLVVSDAGLESPSPFYRQIENRMDPGLVKKYGSLPSDPSVNESDRCSISRDLYLGFTEYIEDIRRIKDTGEDQEEWTTSLAADRLVADGVIKAEGNMSPRQTALDDVKLYLDYTKLPAQGKPRTKECIQFSAQNPELMTRIKQIISEVEPAARELSKRRRLIPGYGYGELSQAQGIYDEIESQALLPSTLREIDTCLKK